MIYVVTLMVVVSRSTIIETVSRMQFETAVAHLEARHRICARSSKTDNSWSGQMAARQWSPGSWPPPTWPTACTATLLNADLDTGKTLYTSSPTAMDWPSPAHVSCGDGRDILDRVAFLSGPSVRYVSVSVFDGGLIANTVYVEEFVESHIMRTMSEGFVRRLDSV